MKGTYLLPPTSVSFECSVEGTRDFAGADDMRVLTKLAVDHNGGGARLREKALPLQGTVLGRMVSMSWRNGQPWF